jgi:Cu(I)/Ag(I) efflux system membrane fusion protein
MKTKIFAIAIAFFAVLFAFTACHSHTSTKASTEKAIAQKEVYTCEMHPQVISNKPGKCPICGMELVKKMVPDTTKVTQ